jgi:hypothetical protein
MKSETVEEILEAYLYETEDVWIDAIIEIETADNTYTLKPEPGESWYVYNDALFCVGADRRQIFVIQCDLILTIRTGVEDATEDTPLTNEDRSGMYG